MENSRFSNYIYRHNKNKAMIKKRMILDYKNVPDEVLQLLAEKYPHGYQKAIIKYKNAKGETVSAVPIETDEISYLVKVSIQLKNMVANVDLDDFDDLDSISDFDGQDESLDDSMAAIDGLVDDEDDDDY